MPIPFIQPENVPQRTRRGTNYASPPDYGGGLPGDQSQRLPDRVAIKRKKFTAQDQLRSVERKWDGGQSGGI